MENKHFPYVLGIDLGANSIGWTVLSLGDDGEPIDIHRAGGSSP